MQQDCTRQQDCRNLDRVYSRVSQVLRPRDIFLEDFGGHATTGPASLWSLQDLRSLHGRYDASRGATFLCRIAGADRKGPLGIFTNLPGLQNAIVSGWPDLKRHGNVLHHLGPLPKSCGCSPPHPPRIGVPCFILILPDSWSEVYKQWQLRKLSRHLFETTPMLHSWTNMFLVLTQRTLVRGSAPRRRLRQHRCRPTEAPLAPQASR